MKPIVITQKITLRDTDSFKKYLQEVDSIETLTADEEYEIAMKAHAGDESAIEELILRNLRFVISVAKQYAGPNAKLEELVNEGNYGLVKAASRFDPTKGFKFISYAVWWIRRSILEHMTKYSRIIRVPCNKIQANMKLDDKYDEFVQVLEREPTFHELRDMLDVEDFSDDDIKFYLNKDGVSITSLDRQFDEDGGNLLDIIGDDTFGRTDDLIVDTQRKENIKKLVDMLPKGQQKRVLILLFGLDGNPEMSLKEVGDELGVTRERVRQVRDKAFTILKRKIESKNLYYILD